MAQPRQPPETPETPDEPKSVTLALMNDPNVSSFLKFFNAVAQVVTAAALIGLFTTVASWQTNNQRMGWLLEQLSREVKQNTQTNEKQEERIRDMQIDLRVSEETNKNHGWRINRLEQRSGLNR